MITWPWFKRSGRSRIPEASQFAVTDADLAAAAVIPLETEVDEVRTDYLQTIIDLGLANAHTRRILAEQTLVNVQRKIRHATQPH